MLHLAITDPWTFGSSLHTDFLRATLNLRLLAESVTFPSFAQSFGIKRTLNVEDLYRDLIVLHVPFFRQKVCSLTLPLFLKTLFDLCLMSSENCAVWYVTFN